MKEYKALFQESTKFTVTETMHAIVLKEGFPIPTIQPYPYPHSQKGEIEKFVKDMLSAGLIRSVSPFSSPLILVKKKDGSWKFCVDY